MAERIDDRMRELRSARDQQCSPGNWDYSEYMRGLANGLILAVHIMDNEKGDPPYFEAPMKSKGGESK